ncbi:MAG: hypothetical protein KGJ09_09210 [Candidatus Omnitrophica bacterium]|nr:hypothetical protein [Candidatus Omnitrophota bacterium]
MSKTTWSAVPPFSWDFAKAVTPSDANVLKDDNGNPIATVGLYIGTAGFLVVDLVSGATGVIFPYVQAGSFIWGAFNKVRTASTCGNMLALW